MKQHRSFMDTAESLVDSDWGLAGAELEEAQRELIKDPGKLAAYSLLALMRRLGGGRRQQNSARSLQVDEDAGRYPGKRVGDRLFHVDLEPDETQGLWECVIVAMNDSMAMVVSLDDWCLDYPPEVRIANGDWWFSSPSEALADAAQGDEDYHAPRAQIAKDALKASSSDGAALEFLAKLGVAAEIGETE